MESPQLEDIIVTLDATRPKGKRATTRAVAKEHKLSALEAQEIVKTFSNGGAEALYRTVDPEAIVQALREESENRRRYTRTIQICAAAVLVISLLAAFFAYRRGGEFDTSAITVLVLTSGLAASFTGKHRLAVRLAATLRDKRAFGPLIDCLDSEEADVPKIAIEAMVPLLPNIEPGDAAALTEAQRNLFAKVVDRKLEESIKLAYIAAYEATLLKEAIPTLEALANTSNEKKVSHKLRTASQMALGNIRIGRAKKIIEQEATHSQAKFLRASGDTHKGEIVEQRTVSS